MRMRIQEAQQKMAPTDPDPGADPEHWQQALEIVGCLGSWKISLFLPSLLLLLSRQGEIDVIQIGSHLLQLGRRDL
jgi:hypothetical protein